MVRTPLLLPDCASASQSAHLPRPARKNDPARPEPIVRHARGTAINLERPCRTSPTTLQSSAAHFQKSKSHARGIQPFSRAEHRATATNLLSTRTIRELWLAPPQ